MVGKLRLCMVGERGVGSALTRWVWRLLATTAWLPCLFCLLLATFAFADACPLLGHGMACHVEITGVCRERETTYSESECTFAPYPSQSLSRTERKRERQ